MPLLFYLQTACKSIFSQGILSTSLPPVLVLLSGLAGLRKWWHLRAYTYETLVLRFHSLSLYSVAEADLTFLSLPPKLELKVCSALHSFLILISVSPSPSLLSFFSSLPPILPFFLIPLFLPPSSFSCSLPTALFYFLCLSFWNRVSCNLVEPWIMDPSKCWGITDMPYPILLKIFLYMFQILFLVIDSPNRRYDFLKWTFSLFFHVVKLNQQSNPRFTPH